MSDNVVDARGKSCPQPVMETRKALAQLGAGELRVLVDNSVSAENVSRMARSMGCQVRIEEEKPGEIRLLLTREAAAADEAGAPDPAPVAQANAGAPPRHIVLISSSEFGTGEKELGGILMRGFIKTLKEVTPLPRTAIFVNRGVYLTTEGSPLLDDIRALANLGVRVLSCGTCLDYYHLTEKLEVGEVSNMFEVVSQLTEADRIIRP